MRQTATMRAAVVKHKTTALFEETYVVPLGVSWLQRKLISWLSRRGALDGRITETYEVIEYKNLDAQPLVHMICDAINRLEEAHGRANRTLFIGVDKWRELTGNPECQHYLSYQIDLMHQRTFFDVPVRVVPWMEGWVIV